MRTTLDLPDPLYQRLKLQAAKEGKTLRELVIRYLEEGLRRGGLLGLGPYRGSSRPGGASPFAPTGSFGPFWRKRVNLLDLNVWFALLVPEHPFHPRARAYWEEASDPFLVRVTALGLLRLLTNAKAMDGKPLGVREAWAVYRELRLNGDSSFGRTRGPGRPGPWGGLSPRLWTDAYLAAFALAGGHHLVTFDQGFLHFPGLEVLRLFP